jgi:hypothetical protein
VCTRFGCCDYIVAHNLGVVKRFSKNFFDFALLHKNCTQLLCSSTLELGAVCVV